MSLVPKIKHLTGEAHMTIAELERKLDLGNGTISRWDKRTPGIDKVKKVANFFDVSLDYLMDNEAPKTLENKTIAKQLMLRSDGYSLSEEDALEIEQEIERFLNWRLAEIQREHGGKK